MHPTASFLLDLYVFLFSGPGTIYITNQHFFYSPCFFFIIYPFMYCILVHLRQKTQTTLVLLSSKTRVSSEADWVSADILLVLFYIYGTLKWAGVCGAGRKCWTEKAKWSFGMEQRCHAIYPERLITKPPNHENKPIFSRFFGTMAPTFLFCSFTYSTYLLLLVHGMAACYSSSLHMNQMDLKTNQYLQAYVSWTEREWYEQLQGIINFSVKVQT